MNEPYRLRYTNQIVGVFLMIVLLLVIALLVVLLHARNLLTEQDNYWIEISQAQVSDLNRGSEVMILGERAGMVEEVHYIEQSDQVRVNLSIDAQWSDQIFEDSFIDLEHKFGLGTPILVIRRGGSGDRPPVPLGPGNQLVNFRGEIDRVEQMSQELESASKSIRLIQQQLSPTLTDISSAANRFSGSLEKTVDPAFSQTIKASASLYQTSEEIRPETLETLQAIRAATKNLESRFETLTENVQKLVEKDMRETLVEVRESTDDISAAAKSVNQTSQDVNKDVADTLLTLRDAVDQVHKLAVDTQNLVRVLRREADDLPGTTARINNTANDAQELVGEIRSHWLLRRYTTHGKPTSQVSPSSIRPGAAR